MGAVLYYECINLERGWFQVRWFITWHRTAVAIKETHFIITFWSHTDTTLYLSPWSDSVLVFVLVLVLSGDKWSDGARGLARGHPDPSGYSTRWLRQRSCCLCPPLLTVSQSINESFKCMDQQYRIRTFLIPKKERFISFRCNYATGWLGTSFLRREEKRSAEQTGAAPLCGRGHFRLLITPRGMMWWVWKLAHYEWL